MATIRVCANTDGPWLDESHGIRDNTAFENYRSADKGAAASFREVACLIKNFVKNNILYHFTSPTHRTLLPETTQKKALVVFFHGLNGRPTFWDGHIKRFEKLSENFSDCHVELFAPEVPSKGHCVLEDPRMQAMYQKVREWAENNPGKPIVLFGQSYGTRVALRTEVFLRTHAPSNPVYVSLTGGALYGTSRVTRIAHTIPDRVLKPLTLGLLATESRKELSLGSPSSKDLLEQVRLPLGEGVAKRTYRKYSAVCDVFVSETGSSLPILNVAGTQEGKKEKDFLVPRYGHNSLIDTVADEQVAKCLYWIHKRNGVVDAKKHYELIGPVKLRKSSELVETVDCRSVSQKIADVVIAIFRGIRAILLAVCRRLSACRTPFVTAHKSKETYTYKKEELPWNSSSESQGLYLFIHGLRGFPADLGQYIEEVRRKNPHAHLFAPRVAKGGNCKLTKAATPFVEVVEDYLSKFPGKPVTILGVSNGARIATYIEGHMRPEMLGSSRLSIVSLSGVQYGTSMATFLEKSGLARFWGLKKNTRKELVFGSQVAQENLAAWRQRQSLWKAQDSAVRHLFCASTEDEQVRSLHCALPYHESAISDYKIYNGQTHVSIIDGALDDVMRWLETR